MDKIQEIQEASEHLRKQFETENNKRSLAGSISSHYGEEGE